MSSTGLPNGLSVSEGHAGNVFPSVTSTGKQTAHGTVVVPSGAGGTAFDTGLTTVEFAVAAPYWTVVPVTGYVGVGAQVGAGGTVTLIGLSGAGTVATANGTATWFAIGT